MKVLIIEDEKPASRKLVRQLSEINPKIEVVKTLESVEGAVNWLTSNEYPELIFMDIQLEDGLCFEIFEKVTVKCPVVFTTAYDEYAIRAFKVNSVDYLLKPIDLGDLDQALKKYETVFKTNSDLDKINILLKQLNPAKKERFLVKVGDHYKSVQTNDINCFFVREKCGFIHVGNGRIYAIDYSLDKVEQLVGQNMFFRVNRNFILNYSAIEDIVAYSSNRLKIKLSRWNEDDDILVSRDRVSDFKQWMDR